MVIIIQVLCYFRLCCQIFNVKSDIKVSLTSFINLVFFYYYFMFVVIKPSSDFTWIDLFSHNYYYFNADV